MPGEGPPAERVRAAEIVGALSLATDLGMGLPMEHGLRTTLVAMRLAERLGVDAGTASDTYYVSLLAHAGCTTDASMVAALFPGGLTTHVTPVMFGSAREQLGGVVSALQTPGRSRAGRIGEVTRRLPRATRTRAPHFAAMCEVAEQLGEQLGLRPSVPRLFRDMTERWDGKSALRRARGDEIPLALRITHVAMDATVQRLLADDATVARVLRERAGHAFDPDVVACFLDDAEAILGPDADAAAWDAVQDAEPEPRTTLDDEVIDRALVAMAGFTDLLSPHLAGHSVGVAELAAAAAVTCGLDASTAQLVRRAGLVHDLGRVAVPSHVWEKDGPLSVDEWEQVRLHPYHAERILCRSPFLATLAPIAGAHHERLDRSGYHRGAAGGELVTTARVLAAADAYHAMTEARPHRPALAPEDATELLAGEAETGRLDADAVAAVIQAAGQRTRRLARPAGLTERETEVLRLVARGLLTKQIAQALGISAKTADRHIQNVYAKLGVSTRPAATLLAIEHGLLAWGDLPIAAEADHP